MSSGRATYRTAENELFFEDAFDSLVDVLGVTENAMVLDAGCGIGAHAIRLARRGFLVQGVDVSESVLALARENIRSKQLETRIRVQRENLLGLSFASETFDVVLCWGVLMHIPSVDRALSELARVLKRQGLLVVSETNMYSLQAIVFRSLKRFLGTERAQVKRSASGIEHWTGGGDDMLLTREADIRWLSERCAAHGLSIRKRLAGQFTEAYTRVSSPAVRRIIHRWNAFYFKRIRIPQLAFGNILVGQREG